MRSLRGYVNVGQALGLPSLKTSYKDRQQLLGMSHFKRFQRWMKILAFQCSMQWQLHLLGWPQVTGHDVSPQGQGTEENLGRERTVVPGTPTWVVWWHKEVLVMKPLFADSKDDALSALPQLRDKHSDTWWIMVATYKHRTRKGCWNSDGSITIQLKSYGVSNSIWHHTNIGLLCKLVLFSIWHHPMLALAESIAGIQVP